MAKLDLCLKKFQRHGGSWWSPPLPVTSCPMQRCLHGRCQLLAFLVRRSVRSGPHAVRPGYSSVPCCGLMNTIYSAPNHLHERHRSPYSRYYVGLRFELRPGAGEALSSVSHHTYLPGTRHKTGSTAHGRIQIQAQFEAKAISRPIGSRSVGGAKNVLQQLTWEWGLGEAERAERVGETTQYCTEHGVGGVLITNRTYAPPGMAAGLSLSYC